MVGNGTFSICSESTGVGTAAFSIPQLSVRFARCQEEEREGLSFVFSCRAGISTIAALARFLRRCGMNECVHVCI